jgi:hypothetical protein
MGLKSGETGAKAQLLKTCSSAFQKFSTLLDARNGVGKTRRETAVVVDMNVILMSVPQSIQTLQGFVNIVWGFVEWALGTGWVTILVFDEPSFMTNAKKIEQQRRDAARTARTSICSDDLDRFPFTDNYALEDLENVDEILAVRDKRPCRSRLYDEVSKQIFEKACLKATTWNASGNPAHETVILFDGIDVRGCSRPPFEKRDVKMVSNRQDVADAFARTVPIGEGDIKIQDVEDRIRTLSVEGGILSGTRLVVQSTIDTDSLMIGLLGVSKRRLESTLPTATTAPIQSLLCMRSAASKRQRTEPYDPSSASSAAFYLTVDIVLLEALILEHLFGKSYYFCGNIGTFTNSCYNNSPV